MKTSLLFILVWAASALLGCAPRYILKESPVTEDGTSVGSVPFNPPEGDEETWTGDGMEALLDKAKGDGLITDYEVKKDFARATYASGPYSELQWWVKHQFDAQARDGEQHQFALGMALFKLRERPAGVTAEEQLASLFGSKASWEFAGLAAHAGLKELGALPVYRSTLGAVVIDGAGNVTHVARVNDNASYIEARDHFRRELKVWVRGHYRVMPTGTSGLEYWMQVEAKAGRSKAALAELQKLGLHPAPLADPTLEKLAALASGGSELIDAFEGAAAKLVAPAATPFERASAAAAVEAAWVKLEPVLSGEDRKSYAAKLEKARATGKSLVPGLTSKAPSAEAFAAPIASATSAGMTGTAAVLHGLQARLTGGEAAPVAISGASSSGSGALLEGRKLAVKAALAVFPAVVCAPEHDASLCQKLGGGDAVESNIALRDLLAVRLGAASGYATFAKGNGLEPLSTKVTWKEGTLLPNQKVVREMTNVEIEQMGKNPEYEAAVDRDPEVKKANYTLSQVKDPGNAPDSSKVDTSSVTAVMDHNAEARRHNNAASAINEAELVIAERRREIARTIPPTKLVVVGVQPRMIEVQKQDWKGDLERTVWFGDAKKEQKYGGFVRGLVGYAANPSQGIRGYSGLTTEAELRARYTRERFDPEIHPWLAAEWKKATQKRIDAHVDAQTGWTAEQKALEKRALRHLFVEADPSWTVTAPSVPLPPPPPPTTR